MIYSHSLIKRFDFEINVCTTLKTWIFLLNERVLQPNRSKLIVGVFIVEMVSLTFLCRP